MTNPRHRVHLRRYILLLLPLAFLSCGSNKNEENQTFLDSLFCPNEIALIQANDSVPEFIFDLKDSLPLIHEKLDKEIGMNSCDKTYIKAPFDLKEKRFQKSKNSIDICFAFEKYCNIFDMRRRPNSAIILINAYDMIFFEGKPLENTGDLPKKVRQVCIDDEEPLFDESKAHFLIQWDKDTDSDSLSNLIYLIFDGYLQAANEFSEKKFQRSLCNSDSVKVQQLREMILPEIVLGPAFAPVPEENLSINQ